MACGGSGWWLALLRIHVAWERTLLATAREVGEGTANADIYRVERGKDIFVTQPTRLYMERASTMVAWLNVVSTMSWELALLHNTRLFSSLLLLHTLTLTASPQ